jgi:two-component sensor histidine kinase
MDSSDEPPPEPVVLALDLHEHLPPLAALRRRICEVFVSLDQDSLEDLQLTVTELVSNAYDHGRHPRQLRLQREEASRRVRVEVEDASRDAPVLGQSRFDNTRGRGLIIVNNVSENWGVTWYPNGKTVWAELLYGT